MCSQAPEDATKLTSLLPMMLVMVKVNYLLTTFTSIQLGQLSVFVCLSTEKQVDMVLPLYWGDEIPWGEETNFVMIAANALVCLSMALSFKIKDSVG